MKNYKVYLKRGDYVPVTADWYKVNHNGNLLFFAGGFFSGRTIAYFGAGQWAYFTMTEELPVIEARIGEYNDYDGPSLINWNDGVCSAAKAAEQSGANEPLIADRPFTYTVVSEPKPKRKKNTRR
jgi:hypothetical protein